jgi:hypothetical protein
MEKKVKEEEEEENKERRKKFNLDASRLFSFKLLVVII